MIPIFSPSVGSEEIEEIKSTFDSSWLGRGQQEKRFKARLASRMMVNEAQLCLTSSCTELIFAFVNLFVPKNKLVLIPTISFPAIGSALLEYGCTFELVDVDMKGNIDLDSVSRLIKEKDVGAIFLTHYGSESVDILSLRKIVGNDIKIIEDAACALGGSVNGRAIGTDGDFACWSFDAMKLITVGDGGLGFCKKTEDAKLLREYLYLGLPESEKSGLDKSKEGVGWWEYSLERPGRRAILNDVASAMGIAQLEKIDDFLAARRRNISILYADLKNVKNIDIVTEPSTESSGYYFTISTTSRDELALFLKDNQIYTTFRYWPLHKMNLFKSDKDFPNANRMADTYLNIPCHNKLSQLDLEYIVEKIKLFYSTKTK